MVEKEKFSELESACEKCTGSVTLNITALPSE